MEAIINNLNKNPLYLMLTTFRITLAIILAILYIIKKRIEKKIEEIIKSKHIINNSAYDKVIEHNEAITQKHPQDPYTYYYLAISHYKAGNIQEALKNFEKAEKLAGIPLSSLNTLTSQANKIKIYIDKARFYKKYAEVLELKENLYKKYARILKSEGKIEEASTYYKKALNQTIKSTEEEEIKTILNEISKIYKGRLDYEN
jgi:tetratricopeptide (TPR) repeat protein